MKKLLIVFAILLTSGLAVLNAQTYGNEWINYSKTHYKFQSDQEGIHRISHSTLQAAGVNLLGADFKLFTNGKQIPVYVTTSGPFGPGDYIEFYGTENDGEYDTKLFDVTGDQVTTQYSLFDDTRTFFLVSDSNGSHLRFEDLANNLATPLPLKEQNFNFTARKSLPQAFSFGEPYFLAGIFNFFSTFDKGEGWLSGLVKSNVPQNVKVTTPSLDVNATGTASVTTRIAGRSRSIGVIYDQEMGVTVNGTEYLHESFSKFDTETYSFNMPLSMVSTTPNAVTNLVQTTLRHEAFDGFTAGFPYSTRYSVAYSEITYPRLFQFDDEPLFKFKMDVDVDKYIEIENFLGGSAPVLYDLSARKRILPVFENGVYRVAIDKITSNTIGTTRNFVIGNTTSAFLIEVEDLEPRDFVKYNLTINQGDYLMITNPLLRQGATDNVQEYADYRSTLKGGAHDVVIIDINELYDQFSAGIEKHPMSIKGFVNYAVDNWAIQPNFLYLMGKSILYSKTRNSTATFDQCLVPTYGYLASDLMLVSQTTQDYYPRLPVGRLSANNAAEVGKYLDKVIKYESWFCKTECGEIKDREWMKNTLHISKGWGQDQTADFSADLNGYEDQIENSQMGYHVVDLFEDDIGQPPANNFSYFYDAPEEMVGYWQQGLSFINFVGHSFGTYWQYDISRNPEEDYANECKYPFVLSNSCFVGQIHESTTKVSMSEDYIHACNSGAIVFVAAVALSSPGFLQIYTEEFLNVMTGDLYGFSISEGLQQTIQNIYAPNDPGIQIVCSEFTYNGDPAIQMYHWDQPEYYYDESMVEILPAGPIDPSETSEVTITVDVANYGKAVDGTFSICVIQEDPVSGAVVNETQYDFPAPAYKETYELVFDISQGSGTDQLKIQLDCNNSASEDCEEDNDLSFEVQILDSNCEELNLGFVGLNNAYCKTDSDVQLDVIDQNGATLTGESFTIDGQTASEIDPSSLSVGTHDVAFSYALPSDPTCTYSGFTTITIYDVPDSFFSVSDDELCLDGSSITVDYSGIVNGNNTYDWDFGSGASVTDLGNQVYELSYPSAGDREITLTVTNLQGCEGETFSLDIEADVPLADPDVFCTDQTSNSVEFSWFEIPNATSYVYQINGSSPLPLPLNVLSFEIDDLAEGEIVEFSIQAISNGACQTSTLALASCQVSNCAVLDLGLQIVQNFVCEDEGLIDLSVTVAGGDFDSQYVDEDDLTFDAEDAGPGTYEIDYEYEENSCEYSETVTITVYEAADADVDGVLSFCAGGQTVLTADDDLDYLWEPLGSMEQSVVITEAGDYTLFVTNEFGCQDTRTVTVELAEEPDLGLNANNTQVAFCYSDSDYEFDVDFSGGDFIGSGIEDGEFDPSNAGLGIHEITYQYEDDDTECIWVESITFQVFPDAVAEIEGDENFCEGGQVTLVADQAAGSSYVWLPGGQQGNELVVDEGGEYTLVVTTENGCEDTRSIFVSEFESPEIFLESTSMSICEGESVTIDASTPGVSGEYSWEQVDGIDSIDDDVLEASPAETTTFNVTFESNSGCISTNQITVEVNEGVQAEIEAASLSFCEGETVMLSGDGNFDNYTWFPGGIDGQEIEVESGGEYTLVVSNNNGCEDSKTIEIEENEIPTIFIEANQVSICIGETVLLDAATPGTDGDYDWDSDESIIEINGDEVTASPVENTTYSVSYTAENGCTNTASVEITIATDNDPVAAFSPSSNEICAGDFITLNNDSENAVESNWTITNLDTGEEIELETGIPNINVDVVGLYSVTLSIEGCGTTADSVTDMAAFEVVADPTVSASTAQSTVCEGTTITLSASGTGDDFDWSGPGLIQSQGDEVTALVTSSSTFTVTTQTGIGCFAEDQITVNVAADPEVSADASALQVCGGEEITLTASGDPGTFSWEGNGLITTQGDVVTAMVQNETTFMVTSENGFGCISTASVTVELANTPTLDVFASEESICDGGAIDLTAFTNDAAADITWTGDGLVTSEGGEVSANVSSTTTFMALVENSAGCSRLEEITIIVEDSPEVTLEADALQVCAGELVNFSALTDGGDYQYDWSGAGLDAETGSEVTAIIEGTVEVQVAVTAGECTSIRTINIEALPTPALEVSSTAMTVCAGDAVTLFAESDQGDIEFDWSGEGIDNEVSDQVSLEINETTTFTVSLELDGQCSVSQDITVIALERPEFDVTASSLEVCPGDIVTLSVDGNVEDYSWSGPGLDQNTGSVVNAEILGDSEFVVTANAGTGCKATKSIMIEDLGDFPAYIAADTVVCVGEEVTLEAIGGVSYNWLNTDVILDLDADVVTLVLEETTTFEVEVEGENGCMKLVTFDITADSFSEECKTDTIMPIDTTMNDRFFIPNAITPNGDGYNDTWVIQGLEEVGQHKILIYNRWGELLLETTEYANDWDGTRNGKQLPHSTYYYIADIPGASTEMLSGTITILK